jgi:outer membrane protein TolC
MLKYILFYLIFFLQINYYAQTDSLTLNEAIDLALKNNQNLTLANLEIEKSRAALKEVKANLYPSFYGTSHYLFAPENGYDPVVTNGGEYGIQLNANYTLFDGGVRNAQINKASVNIEVKKLTLEQTKSEIRYLVRIIYYQILSAKNELFAQKKGVKELTDYLQLLQQLKSGGIASESDVLKTKVDLNNLNSSLETVRENIEKLKFNLNNLLGRPIDKPFDIYENSVIDSLAQFNIENNNLIDLEVIKNEAKTSSYDINITKGEKLPQLSITGDAGVLGVKPNNIKQNVGYSLFFSFSVPLFTWGAIDSRIQQAEISQKQALTNVELTDRTLQTQRLSILSEIELAKKNMKNYQSSLKTAEENYLASEIHFKGGSGTNLDVLDAHRLVIQAELDYNNAVLQYHIAIASLLRLYGM